MFVMPFPWSIGDFWDLWVISCHPCEMWSQWLVPAYPHHVRSLGKRNFTILTIFGLVLYPEYLAIHSHRVEVPQTRRVNSLQAADTAEEGTWLNFLLNFDTAELLPEEGTWPTKMLQRGSTTEELSSKLSGIKLFVKFPVLKTLNFDTSKRCNLSLHKRC